MDVKEILTRADAYIEAHGLEDQSDEGRRMAKIRHLKDLIERHLAAMKDSDTVRREILGSEIDAAVIELEKLLG